MRNRLLLLLVPLVAVAAVIAFTGDSDDNASAAALVDPNGKVSAPKRPNVVMIIMDEFPGDSLLDGNRRIDPVRYPNVAALAGNATWFPNAFTRYDSTPKAVPLIMDSKRPYLAQPADQRGHRHSIFDLFGRRGYSIHDSEEATAVCPRRYCPRARTRRPAIIPHLNRGRPERLDRFLASIKPGKRPGFWLKHVLLPHGPYLFLPSGAQARSGARDLVPGMNSPQGFHDRFLTQHNYQRYLLQLGYTDRELGKLFRRLIRLGMFDSTMIVLVADHGFAWEVGVKDRRKVNEHNVDEIGTVPLLIKAAGQRKGRINRSYVSTLDVTPTVADILNFKLPYRADGRSAYSRAVRRRRVVSLPTRDFSRTIRISARRYEARRRHNVARRLALFGSGPWASLFNRIGPHRDLIGKRVPELRQASASALRGRILGTGLYRSVSSRRVPSEIVGDLRGGKRGAKHDVAVAVNGVVLAVGRTWYLRGRGGEHFAFNVPESSFHTGRNSVEVFQVSRSGVLRRVARV